MKTAAGLSLAAALGLLATSPSSSYVLPKQSVNDGAAAARSIPQLAAGMEASSQRVKRNAGQSITLPLVHNRAQTRDSVDKVKAFALRQKAHIEAKYGRKPEHVAKRQTIGLTDVGPDTFYYAQASVGTPAQNFNLVLDTGSADLWVADNTCTDSQCSGINLYNPGASSTSVSSSTQFEITYGSGAVEGVLYADTVSLAGYTVYNTTVAGVDKLAQNTISAPSSGIMGMGFQSLASSGATPFWEVLAESGKLSSPAFSFQLQRNALTVTSETQLSAGGVFTLGQIDSAQYSGDITYTSLPNTTAGQAGYWAIPLDSVSIDGSSVDTSDELAAIDTGTTLIGGPADAVREIYSKISNSQQVDLGSGSSGSSGYYAFPCSSAQTVAFTFGGKSWTLNSSDFNAGAVDTSGTYCLGSIFATDLGSGAPDWIVGDSFLKNVFAVFSMSPKRVGFAALKGSSAQDATTTSGAVPSGTSAAQSTAAASSSGSSSDGGVGPPSISVNSAASTQTGIVGGSGLPAPVAAATNDASTATSLTSSASSSFAPSSASATDPSSSSSSSSASSLSDSTTPFSSTSNVSAAQPTLTSATSDGSTTSGALNNARSISAGVLSALVAVAAGAFAVL